MYVNPFISFAWGGKAHNQCSEGFYKKEIESDIHGGPSRSAQERQQMMEVLKKFKEESMDQPSLSDDDEDDGGQPLDLAKRFEAVDLGMSFRRKKRESNALFDH